MARVASISIWLAPLCCCLAGVAYATCPAPNDTATWMAHPSTDQRFTPRDGHASTVFQGKLWVIGGQSAPYTTRRLIRTTRRSDIWTSVDGDVWSQVIDESPFPRRFGHSLTVFPEPSLSGQPILVLLGGYVPTPANDIWYSLDGVAWSQVSYNVPWSPRGWHCAITLNSLFYVMGGSPLNNDVWYTSSVVGGNWKKLPSVPWSPRAGHACVTHSIRNATLGDESAQDVGVLLGGWGADTEMLNDVYRIDISQTWVQATPAAEWPVRAFTSLISLHASTPSDYLFGPRLWLLGGGRIGHGIWPMHTYSDVWQSRDGVTWLPISSDALGQSTAGWCQVLIDGAYTCLGKWGHTALVTSRNVPNVNVCGFNCRSESNATNLNGSVIPQCDPKSTPSGATVSTTIVNGIYHMSSSFADGCGVCTTARYYPVTTLPTIVVLGGSTGGDKVADVFRSTDFFLCEKNGQVCSNQGSCVTGGVCMCDPLWGGEYCDQLLPPSAGNYHSLSVLLVAAVCTISMGMS
ncbi:hypothetical protein SPRG_08555 [Saprolegnia parasitica CBS 223.65]|uniref:EGF-like domain-containing protein n=1 Tax=Saprolegnia parasitica (strain CBS 223.65) TaxID=695850 RepID=A0A067C6U8_SAPPC|nr:hypothetical protein SPRG_08555 [Saprolegnia parasitica CBS 223.65]KDO26193.1 hypothetical protein SPRG_08555 [Saprolegnia parasitica CBS 223.65]|eukprot:XP_012203186.1 hypothetical protein SPRG_08555 [Saprolegnia parasitica CBS 223.65]